MSRPWALVVLGVILVAVVAQLRGAFRLVSVARVLAVAGLLVLALFSGAQHHAQGRALIVALVLAAIAELTLPLPRLGGFVLGLGAALGSRVAYTITYLIGGLAPLWGLAGLVVALGFALTSGRRIVLGGRREGGQALANALITYLVVVVALVASGFGTRHLLVALGVLLLVFSDLLLGLNRFVGRRARAALVVLTTSLLGQLTIVYALLR